MSDHTPNTSGQLIVVDGRLPDYQSILATLDSDAEVVILQPGQDGILQLATLLESYAGLDALHLISHGNSAELILGTARLTADNLSDYAPALASIGNALSEQGDILLYGCNIAEGEAGLALVDALAEATGADIAASSDRTAADTLDGNLALEIHSGEITTANAISASAFQEYDYSLATLTVTTGDEEDGNVNFATEASDGNGLSLREAIAVAAAGDTIEFASGVTDIKLETLAKNRGDINDINDDSLLYIDKNLNINGGPKKNDEPVVTLNGQYNGRVLEIAADTDVTLTGLTITGGLLSGAGGGHNAGAGLAGQDALGAAIKNAGTLTLLDSEITLNLAAAGGGAGSFMDGGRYTGAGSGGGGGGYIDPYVASGETDNSTGGADGGGVDATVDEDWVTPSSSGSSGSGGDGSFYDGWDPAEGGSTSGGTGGGYYSDLSGGQGGTASSGNISIGGGGGGGGEESANKNAGAGGSAVGGIYNSGTLNIADTTFSRNLGAGGGGGGVDENTSPGPDGIGGAGAGAILNTGTVHYNGSTTDFADSNDGDAGGDGGAGQTNTTSGSDEADNILNLGTVTTSWTRPPTGPDVSAAHISITSVGSASGTYKIGDTITVEWDNSATGDNNTGITAVTAVTAVTADFTAFGGGASVAAAETASGSNIWTAFYTLVSGNIDAANLNVSISATGTDGTSTTAGTSNLTVDNIAPAVTRVDVPDDGTHKIGDNLDFTVYFDENITLTGTDSTLALTIGNSTVNATYQDKEAGSITYRYTVQAGDLDSDGIAVGALNLGSSTLTDAVGNTADLTLNSIGATSAVKVDGVVPVINAVSIPDAAMKVGDTVTVTITVADDGGDTYTLNSGTVAGYTLTNFSRTNNTTYTAEFAIADGGTDIAAASDISVNVTLNDTAGNSSAAYTTDISQTGDLLDANLPEISGSITPSVNTITDAQVASGFTLTVNFSEAMDTSVTPTLSFPTSGEDPLASTLTEASSGWTDNDTFVVTYSVADANEVIANIDVRVADAKDAAGNLLTAVTQNDIFGIITAPAPAISAITSTSADRSYKVGDSINITVTFDEGVDFAANGGQLQATLNTGATVTLAQTDASNQTSFTASYQVTEGQTDVTDLTVTALNLTGSATLIAKDDGVPADLGTLPASANIADSSAITVDANTPAISTPDLATASDSGISNTDNLTNSTTPTITGSGTEAGASVSIRVGGGEVNTVTVDASGNWSYTFAANVLAEGSHLVSTVVTDTAGNVGSASSNLTLTVDTTAPTAADDTAASVTEDAGSATLTVVNGAASNTSGNLLDNDTDASATSPISAVNALSSNIGTPVAGDNGGLFTVNADGTVSFDTNGDFDSLAAAASETTSVTVTIQDAAGNTDNATLSVNVTGVNDAPTASDNTLNLSYGGSHTFAATDFGFADADTGSSLNSILIKTLPTDGELSLNGTAIPAPNASVSLADLTAGNLTFTPDTGGTGTGYASFTFTVNDGTTDSAAPNTITLNVGARPAPPAPPAPEPETETELVDGVTVEKETTTENGKTVSKVTVEPVTDDREDTDNSSTQADIPLHFDDNDTAVTTVSLPQGVGMTAYDNTTARENNGIADLISMINDVASIREVNAMTTGGKSFLSLLASDQSDLWANEITLTTNSDAPPAAPITIQGSSETGNGYKEALVIDASNLPQGTVLDLKDVEFAVIVGPASLTGGEGANIVYAGGGSQHIVLGEDDDELHGGDGDDTVGSKGGDDLIFGDAGNDTIFGGAGKDQLHGGLDSDTATFDGNRADYEVVQTNGVITVTSKTDSTDVDTLINVEQIQFADQTETFHYDSELEALATLYGNVLGRQADLGGFQWWADSVDNGLTLGGVAANILRSAEAEQRMGSALDSLSAEDQIEAFYTEILGRASDAEGKAHWVNALNNGASLEQIAEGFVRSVELTGQYLSAEEWDFTV